MKALKSLVICLLAISIFSCTKQGKRALQPSTPLLLLPMHDTTRLNDQVLGSAALSYRINTISTNRKDVPDFGRASGIDYQKGILSSYDIAGLSGLDGVTDYRLEFRATGQTIYLTVRYGNLSDKDARKDPCFCSNPQQRVLMNDTIPLPIFGYNDQGYPIYMLPM